MLKESEIKHFINEDKNSEKKRLAAVGQRYFEGMHDILKYRLFYYNAQGELVEDKTRSNIKISHPFFKELVMQLSSYMLSFSENPVKAKESAEGLQEQLDEYFDDEFWSEASELLEAADSKGFGYLYGYIGEDDRLHFMNADSLSVIEVREQDTDDGCKYVIYWFVDRMDKGKKVIKRIWVCDEKETSYYCQINDDRVIKDESQPYNPRPNIVFKDKNGQKFGSSLGYIPFWRLDNNKKQISTLAAIKGIIDDYDLHSCALSNNLVDFDHPLYAVSGYDGTDLDELMQNLRTKKTVGVDADGKIEVKTVDIPYQARKEKLEMDERNIYRFGMGLNTANLKDTNSTTNIAIKMAYTLLDLKANRLEARFKKLLKQLLKVVLSEINKKNHTDYQMKDIYFDFTREVLVNESENIANAKTKAEEIQTSINTLLSVANVLDDESIVKGICDVLDINYEDVKDRIPKQEEPYSENLGVDLNE